MSNIKNIMNSYPKVRPVKITVSTITNLFYVQHYILIRNILLLNTMDVLTDFCFNVYNEPNSLMLINNF